MPVAIKVRLDPTPQQSKLIRQMIWEQRQTWNTLIVPADAASYFAYIDRGQKINTLQMLSKKPSPMKAWFDSGLLCPVHSKSKVISSAYRVLNRAIKSKDRALKSIESMGLKGKKAYQRAKLNFKKYKSIKRYSVEFQIVNKKQLRDNVNILNKTVKVPGGLGNIKFNDRCRLLNRVLDESPDCTVKLINIKRENNKYYAILIVNHELADAPAPEGTSVGIDPGVNIPWTTSDGEARGVGLKAKIVEIQENIKKLQRKAARQGLTPAERCEVGGLPKNSPRRSELKKKQNSSKRRQITMKRINNLHERLANIRRAYHESIAKDLASRYETISIENTQVKNMIKSAKGTVDAPGKNVKAKSGLNRSLSAISFSAFADKVKNSVTKSGGELHRPLAQYSSQTCPRCEHKEQDNRHKNSFECKNCGLTGHADVVAAINHNYVGMRNPEDVKASMRDERGWRCLNNTDYLVLSREPRVIAEPFEIRAAKTVRKTKGWRSGTKAKSVNASLHERSAKKAKHSAIDQRGMNGRSQ